MSSPALCGHVCGIVLSGLVPGVGGRANQKIALCMLVLAGVRRLLVERMIEYVFSLAGTKQSSAHIQYMYINVFLVVSS